MELNEMIVLLIILLFGIYIYYTNQELIKCLVNVNYIECYADNQCREMLEKHKIIN
jgi:hypothetical protein